GFSDINDLAGVRIEFADVFAATHAIPLRLLVDGKVCGLRVDHPDGFYTPAKYFHDLQEEYTVGAVRSRMGAGGPEARLRAEVAEALKSAAAGRWGPMYVVAEKILGENEPLPTHCPVDGTTGSEFLHA